MQILIGIEPSIDFKCNLVIVPTHRSKIRAQPEFSEQPIKYPHYWQRQVKIKLTITLQNVKKKKQVVNPDLSWELTWEDGNS